MSSILEALEKSERERNQENIPRYHSMQPPAEKGIPWKLLLLALLLLSLLVGAYFLSQHFGLFNAADNTNNTSQVEPVVKKQTVKDEKLVHDKQKETSGTAQNQLLQQKAEPTAFHQTSDEVINFSELSDDDKGLLPSDRINVVSVSENKDRSFVMLGSKMYREGNTLGKGAILKEIHKDHILIEFNGRLISRLLD